MATAATVNFKPYNPLGGPPQTSTGTGGESQDRANIDYLLNPYYDTSETRMRGAEQNLGQGVSGSGFGAGTTNRLLQSEQIQRYQLGHQMLEPYLQRSFQAQQAANEEQARLNQIAAEGAQALQRLQLSEAGQTSRLNAQEQAALQRQVLAGQQAMQQTQLQQAGETGRTRLQIGGNILTNLLSRYGAEQAGAGTSTTTRGGNNVSTGGGSTPGYITTFDWASQTPITRTAPTRPLGNGGYRPGLNLSTIDQILHRYGVTV